MSASPELIRVDPSEIVEDGPLPYRVYTVDGALLAAQGTRILDPYKVEILRQEGWRRADPAADVSQPCAAEPRSAAEAPPVRLKPTLFVPLREATALVADDMPLARELLTRLLTEHGVRRVLAVENGKLAITRFFIETPHLVFLDIDMPQLDGLAALKQIRRWAPVSFVCLVSASGTREHVQAALTHQADAFLVKPFTILNMQRVLARYEARASEVDA